MDISKELVEKLETYEDRGFWFFPSWTIDEPITPERIMLPSGQILSIEEIKANLNNEENPLLFDALDFYDLVRELDCDERYRRYSYSFIDEEDEVKCRRRYKNAVVFP